MKLIITIILSFVVMMGSLCSSEAQNVHLSGTILAPTGDSVFLQYSERTPRGFETIVLASAALDDEGHFVMNATLDSARSVMFYDGTEVASLFLFPGDEMTLTLHTAYFDETIRFYGIDGSSARNNFLSALSLAEEMNDFEIASIAEKMDTTALFERIDTNVEKLRSTVADYAELFPEMKTMLDGMSKQFSARAERQKSSIAFTRKLNKLKDELVGQSLLDIAGVDINGKKLTLSSFKGKTTVVDFWATWCGPCMAQMPHLKEMEKKYGKEVNFVSVGTWCKEDEWKEMATELGFEHNMYVSKENADQLKQYMINAIPRYMVIDKDLKIVSIDAPRPSSGELERLF